MISFIEFLTLTEEVNITLDPGDPQGSIDRAKKMLRTAGANPQRAIRQRQMNLKDREDEIDLEDDPDVQKQQERINDQEERTAKERMKLANLQKRKENQGINV